MSDNMLTRSLPFELRAEDAAEGDGLTLEGYAAVFNSPTRIEGWEGLFDEQIAPGAFARSLEERQPVLQFDHGKHPSIGSMPLGRFESIREDAHGLHVNARLHDNWMIQPVRDAIRSGAISGMSFRFRVEEDAWHTADGKPVRAQDVDRLMGQTRADDPSTVLLRTLVRVGLFEAGPVVFPAYADTTVGVRDLSSQPEPSEPKGGSGEGRDASPDETPQESAPLVHVPSPSARNRALKLRGII